MNLRPWILGACLLAPAAAQNINIDNGDVFLTPANTYAAASTQAGMWVNVNTQPAAFPLADINGAPTTATLTSTVANWAFGFDNVLTSGDDEALLDDGADGAGTHTFAGIAPGDYEIYTYAWAPDSDTYRTNVSVPGSPDPAQDVGGIFPGMHMLGITYAKHRITVGPSGTFDVIVALTSGFVTTNGFQLIQVGGGTTVYCTAKMNSLGCTPAISGNGTPSATSTSGFTIDCAMVRNNKSGLLFYSVNGAQASLPFQCGTLCVGPSGIKRTPAQSAGGNPPPANDCSGVYSIDMNAFAAGLAGGNPDPGLLIPGNMVHGQWWGRDQGFASPCNTMLSDGAEYVVQP